MTFMPTLKQLQYLVALHIHGHFGRAADACFVTQSTLSSGLSELESLLGVQLVERSRRVVRFSPMGEQVVAKAYDVLREADALANLTRASGEPLVGDLRLGVIPTIAPYLLPRIMPALRARFPRLDLYLREDMSGPACEALARGTHRGAGLACRQPARARVPDAGDSNAGGGACPSRKRARQAGHARYGAGKW